MKRREFVRTLSLGTAALWAAPAGGLIARAAMPAVGPEGWSGAAFAHLQGATFQAKGPGGVQEMVLQTVTHGQAGGIETASLRFAGDPKRLLPEGTYEFYHPQLGTMKIHVIPSVDRGPTNRYRAAFVRFV